MALSFCTNWGTTDQYLVPEMSSFPTTHSELSKDLFTFQENFGFSDTLADQFFFDPDQYSYSDDSTHHLLPYFSYPSDHLISLSPEVFPLQEFESYLFPKRQKAYEDQHYMDFPPGYFPHPPELMPQLQVPLPEFQTAPAFYGCASVESSGKKGCRESLSAQSIAARQRRRKITEKTQELGKLIPGGNKMNTAEMFQAAFKYVKYLQAQVAILQLMGSLQYNEEAFYVEELQATASPMIQEKLYSVEKCLVSKQFVEALANDELLLQSNTSIFNGIHQLIQPND
ncbi:Transcription factor bHLH52 [Vitis vinifera]|uniref:Transcription factor bHLH52 n=1 Tax=Vitis vinifera TaxID=29760 RepID=A0A438IUR2_VITVI|nr:Transcription factor bHLH52 [Vitis vinifera]